MNLENVVEYFESSDEELELVHQVLSYAQALAMDEAESTPRFGGSLPGKRPNIDRKAEEGAQRLYDDYFSESPVYTDEQFERRFHLYNGTLPEITYVINNHTYNTGYYLADGICPPLATLVQTISSTVGQKRKHFATMQESARKDVERAFGAMTEKFAIIKQPARLWNNEDLNMVMRCCIILHNMIIEDQRNEPTHFPHSSFHGTIFESPKNNSEFGEFLSRYEKVHDTTLHYKIQNDLIEHLWQIKGETEEE
ncbi:uncharacterized protein LOC134204578 [Armigeres subalbatus]|uniref:uncharacterized protein LOC134204578 n=1 Tax=Armigeres subalbatus TaxID=124917 RepID=UPI002ED2EBB0